MEENVLGEVCSTHGRDEKCIQGFSGKTTLPRDRAHTFFATKRLRNVGFVNICTTLRELAECLVNFKISDDG